MCNKTILDRVKDPKINYALMEMYDVFPDRLKLARKRFGMTIEQLAECTGVAQTSISAYERGVHTPSMSVLVAFSLVFGVSTDWFCGLDKNGT